MRLYCKAKHNAWPFSQPRPTPLLFDPHLIRYVRIHVYSAFESVCTVGRMYVTMGHFHYVYFPPKNVAAELTTKPTIQSIL